MGVFSRVFSKRRSWIAVTVALVAAVVSVQQPPDSADAQDPFELAEIVSRNPAGNGPMPLGAHQASISTLGHVVEFDSVGTGPVIGFRDRPNSVTGPQPSVVGQNAAISDDGCVIAYTGGLIAEFTFALMRVNRCTGGAPEQVSSVGSGFAALTPGVDASGNTIAWSRRTNLIVWRQGGSVVNVAPPVPGWMIGAVALSSDGNTVVFESGPTVSGSFVFAETNIWVADVPVGATTAVPALLSLAPTGGPLGNAFDPSISADGSLTAFRGAGGVYVSDRQAGTAAVLVVPSGGRPSISRDGRYLVFEFFFSDAGVVYAARTSDRWLSIASGDFVSYPLPAEEGSFVSSRDAVVSEHGRWVAWSTSQPDGFVDDPLFPPDLGSPESRAVIVRQRRPSVTVGSILYGTVGGPSQSQATVTSNGLAGFVITSIAASGDFTVVADDCPAVLQPGASCELTVQFNASNVGSATGTLTVRDDSYPGVPLAGAGQLSGTVDPTTPTVPIPSSTVPIPSSTVPVIPDLGLSISPDPVVFGGVVVGTAAPEQPASVENTGDVPITVNTVSLSGAAAGDFLVASDACTGVSLAPGAACELVLGFTATAAGGRSATITANGSSSTSASAALRGSGRFDALLEVTPPVAAGGQVVTVVGSGFPPSTTVNVVLGGDPAVPVSTDGSGGFMLQWLILSGVPQGELFADDVAVVGSFDAEPAPLQVVGTPMRPQGTAALSRSDRSHVSR